MKKQKPATQASPLDEELTDALVTTAFVTMAIVTKLGAENDVSLTLVRVLGILADRRPRMTELAEYLGLEKQTMSGMIARAEKRGLVARAPNEDDGRATDVFLTSAGVKLIKRLRLQGQEALAPLTGQLSASDRKQLHELLRRMLDGWNP